MQLDWNSFTPWASLAGGLTIGLAAALYVLGVGRIAGNAGIVGSALQSLQSLRWPRLRPASAAPAWWFLLGLALAPWAWRLVAPLPAMAVDVGPLGLIAAGLLFGIAMAAGMLLHDNGWAPRQRKVAPVLPVL